RAGVVAGGEEMVFSAPDRVEARRLRDPCLLQVIAKNLRVVDLLEVGQPHAVVDTDADLHAADTFELCRTTSLHFPESWLTFGSWTFTNTLESSLRGCRQRAAATHRSPRRSSFRAGSRSSTRGASARRS